MDLTQKLVQLLEAPSPRARIAAAVVVGELGLKDAAVVARLMPLAADPVDALAEPAVEALGTLRAGAVRSGHGR
jgi:HEAT repeat protein